MTHQNTLDAHTTELSAFCDREGLPQVCIEELLLIPTLTQAQREWLQDFGTRWDAMNQPRIDWSALHDVDYFSDGHDIDDEIPY